MLLLVKILIYPLSLLPLEVLRTILLPFKFILKHIIRYREQVVLKNLKIAFPEKSASFYRSTKDAFYDNLFDIAVESIKAFTVSEQEAARRMKVLNPELLNAYASKNQSVILILGHFNNWEWTPFACVSQVKHQIAGIYQPFKHKGFNEWIKQNRSRTGFMLMSTKETKEFYASNTTCVANAFIADQSPSKNGSGEWVDFFGRKTLFLAGAAANAIQQQHPIIFVDIQRIKTGYYTIQLEVLEDNPHDQSVHDITQNFAARIEKQIRQHPGNYLWSHNRWKHNYELKENKQ